MPHGGFIMKHTSLFLTVITLLLYVTLSSQAMDNPVARKTEYSSYKDGIIITQDTGEGVTLFDEKRAWVACLIYGKKGINSIMINPNHPLKILSPGLVFMKLQDLKKQGITSVNWNVKKAQWDFFKRFGFKKTKSQDGIYTIQYDLNGDGDPKDNYLRSLAHDEQTKEKKRSSLLNFVLNKNREEREQQCSLAEKKQCIAIKKQPSSTSKAFKEEQPLHQRVKENVENGAPLQPE